MAQKRFPIAKIGRSVGLRGDLKLNLLTDFPEQFKKNAIFESDRGRLTVESYNAARGVIHFEGIDDPESAKKLTNAIIYSDEESTRELCRLPEGEYFWFDIIGAEVFEGDIVLGVVKDIQRMPSADYLVVETDSSLLDDGVAKSFLIPYIDRYIVEFDFERKRIECRDAHDILMAS